MSAFRIAIMACIVLGAFVSTVSAASLATAGECRPDPACALICRVAHVPPCDGNAATVAFRTPA